MIPGCASPVYQLTVILQPPILQSSLLCRHLFVACCYSQIMGVKVSETFLWPLDEGGAVP